MVPVVSCSVSFYCRAVKLTNLCDSAHGGQAGPHLQAGGGGWREEGRPPRHGNAKQRTERKSLICPKKRERERERAREEGKDKETDGAAGRGENWMLA